MKEKKPFPLIINNLVKWDTYKAILETEYYFWK